MSFQLVPKSVTLNDVMATILRYFAEFGRFHGQFHTVVDLLLICCLSPDKCHKVHQLSTTDALCSSR